MSLLCNDPNRWITASGPRCRSLIPGLRYLRSPARAVDPARGGETCSPASDSISIISKISPAVDSAACVIFDLLPSPVAARSPTLVRSEILSRSNWAMEAKTWNTRRPVEVVVSMSSARDRKPAPRSRIANDLQEIFQEPRQTVVLGDDHNIAVAKLVQHLVQLRSHALRPTDLVRKNLFRADNRKGVRL